MRLPSKSCSVKPDLSAWFLKIGSVGIVSMLVCVCMCVCLSVCPLGYKYLVVRCGMI